MDITLISEITDAFIALMGKATDPPIIYFVIMALMMLTLKIIMSVVKD